MWWRQVRPEAYPETGVFEELADGLERLALPAELERTAVLDCELPWTPVLALCEDGLVEEAALDP